MRLSAVVAVGLLLSACTDADAEAGGEPGPADAGASAVAPAAGQVMSAAAAVSAAVDAARTSPDGRWSYTTTVDFLDSAVRQSVAATREYDRDADRSRLRVDIDRADRREGDAETLPSTFAGRSTEVALIGDDVYVRMTGSAASDQDWYELGETALRDLVAWRFLFVDPLSDRLPLVGLLDPGTGVHIGVGTGGGDGTWSYAIRLPGESVMSSVEDEAPAVTGWLPPALDPSEIDAAVPGTVRVDAAGRLVSLRIDLGPAVAAIADTVDHDFDRDFYSSAQVLLTVTFDHSGEVEVEVPPPSAVVGPAPVLDDVRADEIGVGDCMPAGTDLRQAALPLVRCDDAHTFEVFLVTEGWPADAGYPGRSQVRDESDATCIDGFEDFIGVPFADSVHSVATISPLPEGWERGNRTIVCLAESYLPRRATLAGALE